MKVLRIVSLVLVVLAMASVSRAELVAHWTFDESSGPALDSSGNGYDGTIVGTVGQGETGQIGGAYLFDGSGWVDFGVDTITTEITNFPISVSYWIKSTSTSGTKCAVWMGRNGADQQYMQTGMKNGNANAAYRNTDFDAAAAWKDRGTTATEGDDAWHHIVGVYVSESERHVYVDGILAASGTQTQPYYTGTNQLAVGNNNRRTSMTDPFDGLIDDVQIYDEVLDDGQILAIYADGIGIVATNPQPAGDSVDPLVTTTISWDAPAEYTPEVGYNLVLRKASQVDEPNFAAGDNIIEITDASATSPVTVSLDYDATYYWRVDSFEPSGAVNNASDDILHSGVVWSFTTRPSVPVITKQPSNGEAAVGETAELVLEYTSLSPLTNATWETLPNGATEWVAADGTSVIDSSSEPKTVTLTVSNVTLGHEGLYRCVLSNNGGDTTSDGSTTLVAKRLLAHYEFEGNANDTNPNGGITNDGIATNTGGDSAFADITYGPSGLTGLGDCVVFNASTEATDPNQSYIQLPLNAYPNSDIGGGLSAGTITCWVKPTTTGTIIGSFNDGFTTGLQLSVYNTTNMRLFKRNETNNSNTEQFSNPNLTGGEDWFFVAVSWGDAEGSLRTYIGQVGEVGHVEDIVTAAPANYAAWQYAPTIGGQNARGTIDTFLKTGSMLDDLKIYNYALTPEEIASEFKTVTGNTMCMVTSFEGDYFDTNDDCIVNMIDFADFAAAWMAGGLY